MRKNRVLVTGGAGFLGSHYLLGNPDEFVIKMTGSNSKIVYDPLSSDDPAQRKHVIDLAKKNYIVNLTLSWGGVSQRRSNTSNGSYNKGRTLCR